MKRFANDFSCESSEKRLKCKEDLWGDSDSDIDDILVQASQIVDEIDPATSNATFPLGFIPNVYNGTQSLEHKLQQEVVNKEGEIAILRRQLQQTKEEADKISCRQINDSSIKYETLKKERDTISTKLDFQNLEMVNLRRKVETLTKNLFDMTSFANSANNTKAEDISICQINNQIENLEESLEPLTGTKFPIKSLIPYKLFESNSDDKFPKIMFSKQTSDERYLHSLMFPTRHGQQRRGVFTYIRKGETLKIKHFFEPIYQLKEYSEWDLEKERNVINQIFLLTLQFLINHMEYLTEFAQLVQSDELREYDLHDLRNSNKYSILNCSLLEPLDCVIGVEECAMQCRQCIALLAVIYPYNMHLRTIITNNKLPMPSEHERKMWPFPFNELLSSGQDYSLLNILIRLVSIIGDMRQRKLYTGLLSAICCLLSEIVQFKHDDYKIYESIGLLVSEIVLTTPYFPVLYHLSELFKYGSTSLQFIEQLCKNPLTNIEKLTRKNFVLVNNTCCSIDIYFNLCRQTFSDFSSTQSNNYIMQLNLLQFVTNSINTNVKWMHFGPTKQHLECQKELYKLVIEVVYEALFKYRESTKDGSCRNIHLKTIIKIAPIVLDTLVRKYGLHIEYSQQYIAIMKSSRALLNELIGKFDCWNQYDVERIALQSSCESSVTTLSRNWPQLKLELELLKLE